MMGVTAIAHTKSAHFRLGFRAHPRLSSEDESQPPPMLPTQAPL